MRKIILSGVLTLAVAMPFAARADGTLNLSAGSEYSSGKYGAATPTDVWFYPVAATYRQGDSSISLTVPYVKISGPSNIVGAISNQFRMNNAAQATTRTSAGLGDIVLSGSHTLYANPENGWALGMTGNVKFGTADSVSGLGTGKNDYSLQGDAAKYFSSVDLFGTLGWRKMGNPAGINFNNPKFATLGAGYSLSSGTRLGLAYDFRQRVLDGTANFSELLAFVNYPVTKSAKIQLYLLKGFTDNSPDRGLGATLNWAY